MNKPVAIAKPARQEQIIPIKISFDPLAVDTAKAEALDQLNGLQGATIDNDEELSIFSALLVETTRDRKLIEAMQAEVLAPIEAALKTAKATVSGLFRTALETKQASETQLRALVAKYQTGKLAAQRELMAQAAAAAQARKPDELSKALVAASNLAPVKISGVTVTEKWQAKIKAPDLVPYEWCVPDEKRIAKHARETPIDRDPSPIPGVTFERVAGTTVR
jgi:hypothetical protein